MSPMCISFFISSSNSLADDLADLGEPTVGSATVAIVAVTLCTQDKISAASLRGLKAKSVEHMYEDGYTCACRFPLGHAQPHLLTLFAELRQYVQATSMCGIY